uniref:Uncharacterized protein n=1 Tax=Ciona intestinalis TaxID=7719 RepID=H2XYB5_CIOIN
MSSCSTLADLFFFFFFDIFTFCLLSLSSMFVDSFPFVSRNSAINSRTKVSTSPVLLRTDLMMWFKFSTFSRISSVCDWKRKLK